MASGRPRVAVGPTGPLKAKFSTLSYGLRGNSMVTSAREHCPQRRGPLRARGAQAYRQRHHCYTTIRALPAMCLSVQKEGPRKGAGTSAQRHPWMASPLAGLRQSQRQARSAI